MLIELILYVSDQQLSMEFYSAILKMKPDLDVPGMTEFSVHENLKIGLMPEQGIAKIITPCMPHPQLGNGIPRCELYIRTQQIESDFELALKLGGKKIQAIKPMEWGDLVGYISDRDGHIIAFAKKMQNSEN